MLYEKLDGNVVTGASDREQEALHHLLERFPSLAGNVLQALLVGKNAERSMPSVLWAFKTNGDIPGDWGGSRRAYGG